MRNHLAAVALLLILGGCDAEDERLVGPYRIMTIDIEEERLLCWGYDTSGCATDGLPGPTLFAAGFDDRYIVVGTHPWSGNPEQRPSSIPRFYYLVRDLEKEAELKKGELRANSYLPYATLKGPFDQKSFDAEKSRLHLPGFSRHFSDN